ncbi:RNase P/RNase MRP complex subunit [Maudiozyma exigua]|uniref:Ribonuclease P protein subunit n=1 Tax=Maudiozyma exigua TaxID=34358 RepID=A0A9P6WEN3_MAUEX|nr:RNase P/RNase MRP complex subunit [Kazachstania exigua]
MDEATQSFIKQCLFTKNFNNPSKPIHDNRLVSTVLLTPTDGGQVKKLRKSKNPMRIKSFFSYERRTLNKSHPNYRRTMKRSKNSLKQYICDCKIASKKARIVARDPKITTREQLYAVLQQKQKDVLKKLPDYESFVPMYEEFWLGYIKDVLGVAEPVPVGERPHINGPNSLMKLSMADYNGSLLKVVKSKNKNMVGIQGIVIWDSQKSFIMVTRGRLVDNIKIIPKRGTVFGFEVPINDEEALQYSILGDRFKYRSVDRASRKFKSRRCDDMLYYLQDDLDT